MSPKDTAKSPKMIVACIGAGVIGGGWIARFLLHGWDVNIHDPAPGAKQNIIRILANARRSLPALADVRMPKEGQLVFFNSVNDAVKYATWIQESVPERLDLKQKVIAEIQAACQPNAIIGSSTSGFKSSDLQQGAKRPAQILVAHPFNPVYLLPLVELAPSAKSSPEMVASAQTILVGIGMKPLLLRKEIDAHIADRLLEALWRESLWLIHDGIATTEEIDDAIRFGFGLRCAQMGLFETYRLAGGEAGMAHFLRQFGPALKWPWTKLMNVPELNETLVDTIANQSDAQSGAYTIGELERIRDDNLIGIMRVQKDRDWGVGRLLLEHDQRLASLVKQEAIDDRAWLQPLKLHSAEVLPSWIDYNDHMTEHRYLQVFGDATDALLRLIGVNKQYVASGKSYYTVETHLRHLSEVGVGQSLTVSTQIMSHDEKRLHLFHRMDHEQTGEVLATAEHMLLHVNSRQQKASPADKRVLEKLATISDQQINLEKPEGAGRAVGQKVR